MDAIALTAGQLADFFLLVGSLKVKLTDICLLYTSDAADEL